MDKADALNKLKDARAFIAFFNGDTRGIDDVIAKLEKLKRK